MPVESARPGVIQLPDSLEAVYEYFYEHEMTDGLPIIPPTRERVERMVAATGLPGHEVIAIIPPKRSQATVEKIAANAVMAGCKPEYMPVLLAAVEAMADPLLNLTAISTTTGGFSLTAIINGPVRQELDINCGTGVFGQGFRANATIGRALRLMVTNLGGIYPGKADKGTLGEGGRFSSCIGENEEESPWAPFHTERGYAASDSTITLAGTLKYGHIVQHMDEDPVTILNTVASAMSSLGHVGYYGPTEMFVCLCPEHAHNIGAAGWSKDDVRRFLFDKTRRPVRELKTGGNWTPEWRPFFPGDNYDDDDALAPLFYDLGMIQVLVTGGIAGRMSTYLAGYMHFRGKGTQAVTRMIRR